MRWKPVVGYEGLYEVSDGGDVRSLVYGGPLGTKKRPLPRMVKHAVSWRGYPRVGLCRPGSVRKNTPVHRIVLFAFRGAPAAGLECNHIDGNKKNNSVENLEWVTRRENGEHKARMGLAASGDRHGMRIHRGIVAGERNGRSVLSAGEVYDIRARYSRGDSIIRMAVEYGCSEAAMYKAATGRSWKHLEVKS